MVSALACKARGPGSSPSLGQNFSLSIQWEFLSENNKKYDKLITLEVIEIITQTYQCLKSILIFTCTSNGYKKFLHFKCPAETEWMSTSGRNLDFHWERKINMGNACYVHRCGISCACHAAGPGSFPDRDRFPGKGFFRCFSSPVRQMSGNFRPPRSPNIIWPSSSFHIRLVGMTELMCIVFHVCAVSEVAPALGWSLIRTGPPCPCVVKKVCMWSIV